MSITNRIGTFFILLGAGLIILFILSDLAKTPSCNFLITGVILLALGVVMWMRNPVQPGPKAERFRTVKKMVGRKPDHTPDSKKK